METYGEELPELYIKPGFDPLEIREEIKTEPVV